MSQILLSSKINPHKILSCLLVWGQTLKKIILLFCMVCIASNNNFPMSFSFYKIEVREEIMCLAIVKISSHENNFAINENKSTQYIAKFVCAKVNPLEN